MKGSISRDRHVSEHVQFKVIDDKFKKERWPTQTLLGMLRTVLQ
jgi:hypothetical protein